LWCKHKKTVVANATYDESQEVSQTISLAVVTTVRGAADIIVALL
jgi:hypothetical protein